MAFTVRTGHIVTPFLQAPVQRIAVAFRWAAGFEKPLADLRESQRPQQGDVRWRRGSHRGERLDSGHRTHFGDVLMWKINRQRGLAWSTSTQRRARWSHVRFRGPSSVLRCSQQALENWHHLINQKNKGTVRQTLLREHVIKDCTHLDSRQINAARITPGIWAIRLTLLSLLNNVRHANCVTSQETMRGTGRVDHTWPCANLMQT
mmetsp:Transcript_4038/g.8983  ORF Transcript_4038/g.8983 Transcript_4038/m.8983 type:complete len:205 (+) Transcript_4038:893-1507(+)